MNPNIMHITIVRAVADDPCSASLALLLDIIAEPMAAALNCEPTDFIGSLTIAERLIGDAEILVICDENKGWVPLLLSGKSDERRLLEHERSLQACADQLAQLTGCRIRLVSNHATGTFTVLSS